MPQSAPPSLPRQQEPEPIQPLAHVEPREQITEPLAVPNITVNLVAPEQQTPVVVMQQPPTPQVPVAEKTYVYIPPERRETERFERQPGTKNVPEAVPPTNEKRSEIVPQQEQKSVPDPDENNSKTIPESLPERTKSELFEPDEPALEADAPELEKLPPGRQRKYEDLGENDIEPVREVILYRHHRGKYWHGISKDMEVYYDFWYFTKPNKRKDGKDYERHVRCWERRAKWIGVQA